MPDNFKTPLSKLRFDASARSTSTKRDSLAAELERDPQLSAAKRQHRTQVFNSTVSHAHLERQLLAAQTGTAALETKLRERELQIESLERDRRWLADREREEREEKEKLEEELDQVKRKSDTDLRALRSTLSALHESHADLQDAHSSLKLRSSHTIASQTAQINTLTHQLELASTSLASAESLSSERSTQLASLQTQLDALLEEREAAGRAHVEQEGLGVLRDELHRQVEYMAELEARNTRMEAELLRLRERRESVQVLKEEKRNLEAKLARAEQARERVIQLEGELDAARREREDRTSLSASSSSTAQALSALRTTHAQLLETHGAALASLRHRESALAASTQREGELQAEVGGLQARVVALEEETGRVRRAVGLKEREVGYLRALLASFEAEEAYASQPSSEAQSQPPPPSVAEVKTAKVHELDGLLAEYKAANEELREAVERLTREGGEREAKHTKAEDKEEDKEPAAREKKEMDEQVHRLEEEKGSLERAITEHLSTIDTLEQTLFELRGEIAGGRHVPPSTRVLCLKENPDQAWVDARQETMERLRAENGALLKRLGEVEAQIAHNGGAAGQVPSGEEAGGKAQTPGGRDGVDKSRQTPADLVPRESWEQVTREKAELAEELKQREKRLLRLQQIFTSKSAEFREAIASILGLKLAFYPNGQVRVTSMYDLNASFIFQPASKASKSSSTAEEGVKMQLVAQGEGGPQDLPNLMHYWIEKEQCTAGFLASVTLECYDNWKSGKVREGGEE